MIYLITGNPGTGKTLHMVSMLAKREDLRNRPLYIDGINELDNDKIPYLPMPEGCNGGNWHEWLPDGAIIVIDECQRYWRQRANGSKVPDAVQAMETHRHKGIDIYLWGGGYFCTGMTGGKKRRKTLSGADFSEAGARKNLHQLLL